jgi:Bacterial regulatory proteins, gntR family
MAIYNPTPPPDEGIKWRHIKNELLRAIADGRWQAGDRIPTEAQLETDYKCSRTTVREAIKELCSLGLLRAFKARGTFVLPGAQERARMLLRLDADIEAGKPSGPSARPDGRTWITVYPADKVTFRLPGLGEAEDEGVHRTDPLAIVHRADGSREVYPALNLMIECKERPPSD